MLKHPLILEQMSPEATNIYNEGLIDHYIQRPVSYDGMNFEHICLAEFASRYDFVSKMLYDKMFADKPPRGNKAINDMIEDNQDDDAFAEMDISLHTETDSSEVI